MSSNDYAAELLKRMQNRYSVDSAQMSMGDWICENTSMRHKPFNFNRYPFQKALADDMHPNMDVIKPSQVGLALALDTPIPTPEGWTTMGELRPGDRVFDEKGQPTRVEYVSPVYRDHKCFELTFDTGETIVADAGHRWFVQGHKAFNHTELCFQTGRLPLDSEWRREGVVTTEMLSRNFHHKGRNVFAIPNCEPIQTHTAELPLDPYVLGLWLGDGSSASATLTVHPDDYPHIKEAIEPWGYSLSPLKGYATRILFNGEIHRHRDGEFDPDTAKVYGRLSELNLIRNKHIPVQYLRASESHRRDLLQGLLDTDGSITKNGRVSFHNCNPLLVEGVVELMHSLGLKTRTRWRQPASGTMKNGHEISSKQMIAEVSCMAYREDDLFRLSRKRDRLKITGRREETYRRRIMNVREVAPQAVRCISVASESHLFLAGKGMIPTHNTEVQIRKSLGFVARNRGTTLIFTLPNDKMYKRMSTTRIKPLVEDEKAFNLETRSGEKPSRSMGLYQVGTSFMYVTGATEGDATSISADAVMNDEIDLTDQKMLALFNSRLQNSDWKLNQRFSTPTFANYGVDRSFQFSDQREFLCKCDACNHWQTPLFAPQFIEIPGLPSDLNSLTEIDEEMIDGGEIDLVNAFVKCERCGAPLDLGRNREWVAKFASRDHHRGYRVGPFSTSRLSVEYIITQMLKYKANDYMRGWYNTVLGLAHTDGNSQLTQADIDACFTGRSEVPLIDQSKPTWIGIDMGQICHVIVAQGESVHDLHCVRFNEVAIKDLAGHVGELLATYNVIGGSCDRFPYTPNADEIHEISQGKIVPVEYRGQKIINLVKDPVTEKITHAQVNRTHAIDQVAKAVRGKKIKFSGYGGQKMVISEHLKDMVRDENPEKEASWVKLTGVDHYFHAAAFLLVGITLKETARALFDNPRTTVGLVASAPPKPDGGMFGRQKSNQSQLM